jgi:NAD(P)-dependent dehydrogenase (short-subunit alcohol dehydrogenase family)
MPTLLVTGASRGIGLEFARQYAADGWRVIATTRHGRSDALKAVAGVTVEPLELTDFAAIEALAAGLRGTPIDLVIANAGVSEAHRLSSAADAEEALRVLAVNAIAPTLLAELLAPNVAAAGGRMAAITSKMGSIADSSGGYLAYRASKAALNAAWHALAQQISVPLVLLHPGWVQTDMGGPGAQISPEESVSAMRRVIAGLTVAQSGAFLDHRGDPIPW